MDDKKQSVATGNDGGFDANSTIGHMSLNTELGRRRWIRAAKACLDPDRFISWREDFEQRHPPVPPERQGSSSSQLPTHHTVTVQGESK